MGSDGPTVRRVWTRDGLVALKAPWDSLGITKMERTEAMIAQYADRQVPGLRGPMRDVYLRAYRRAGLLEGSWDEFPDSLPPEADSPSKATRVADSSGDTGEVLGTAQQSPEGPGTANVEDGEER